MKFADPSKGVGVAFVLVPVVGGLIIGSAQGVTPKSGLIYFENFDTRTLTDAIYAINPDGDHGRSGKRLTTGRRREPDRARGSDAWPRAPA